MAVIVNAYNYSITLKNAFCNQPYICSRHGHAYGFMQIHFVFENGLIHNFIQIFWDFTDS